MCMTRPFQKVGLSLDRLHRACYENFFSFKIRKMYEGTMNLSAMIYEVIGCVGRFGGGRLISSVNWLREAIGKERKNSRNTYVFCSSRVGRPNLT